MFHLVIYDKYSTRKYVNAYHRRPRLPAAFYLAVYLSLCRLVAEFVGWLIDSCVRWLVGWFRVVGRYFVWLVRFSNICCVIELETWRAVD